MTPAAANDQLFESILLIEDEESHALIIGRSLRNLCKQVIRASSFAEALRILGSSVPPLIITDLNLPDKPSIGTVKALKAAAPKAFVVVLTSSTSLADAVDAMKQGAHDFIVKGFDDNFNEVLGFSLARIWGLLASAREREFFQRETERLRSAIENGKDGLAIVNSDGAILYSNRSFASFTQNCGGMKEKLSELFCDEVTGGASLAQTVLKNLSTLSAGGVWTTEVAFQKKAGIAYQLSLSALPESSGDRKFFVVWVRDISSEKQRERFQRDILSTTTHDLKGPLGAILISAELLEGAIRDNGRAKDIALRIGSSAQGAINLIDEFLSARRLQEGSFVLKPTKQELRALIEGVMGDFQTIAAPRGISLQLESGEPVEAEVDKLGLARVIGNLLSNALKFTPKGGSVSLSVVKSGDHFHLRVTDSGCGMEATEVQALFARFTRLEKHQEVEGTGLGLYLVKAIVVAHGGKIDVTSKVGQGTTFELTIPVKPPMNERGELFSVSFA